ncbi:metal-dependent hydrolase [Anaerotruncus sp. 80]|uniref:Metal-dependent hydrolase n=1 Tax=Anaerotruncus colihominis TaxID=169435 RepID=A0A845QM36_9FIRM|nr:MULTISPECIES: metal-dependent hydrolase [Anaerotruncus]NBH61793.1 metal-dependent hydrolase [Anaerotruncus colihominis]NCF02448.1 metal-dependent hydrolase [Anaerotruncus sp. 80]
MTYLTHALGGALAGTAVIAILNPGDKVAAAAIMSGAVIGSLLPDIDHTRSKVSRSSAAAKITSYAVSAVTKHRGFFHTPLFVLILALALGTVINILPNDDFVLAAWSLYFGLLPGMLSHLLLDTCNPGGIMWLYPVSNKKLSILPIKTGSLGEIAVAIILAVLLAGWYGIDIMSILHR